MSREWRGILGMGCLGLVGSILWVAYADGLIKGPDGGGVMSRELHNTAFQFWVIVAMGGTVSFYYQWLAQSKERRDRERQEEREQKDEQKRLLLQTYNELLAAYRKTKRARRVLRARVLQSASETRGEHEHVVLASVYDTQMEALTDAELDFDSIERRMEGNLDLFDSQFGEFKRVLKTIGDYLRSTLEEYEDQRTEFSGDPERRALSALPRLMEFVGPKGAGPEYARAFEGPFREALRRLRGEVQQRSALPPSKESVFPPAEPTEKIPEAILGRKEGEVRLVPHRPEWHELFECEAKRLGETFREAFASIEHVGSTAVPGLLAEPVIDLVAVVETLEEGRQLASELAGLRYIRDPDAERDDRLVLCRWEDDDDRCTHHLILVPPGSDYAETLIRLRDLLREDEGARQEFELAKRELYRAHRTDPAAYWEGVRDAGTALVRRGEVPRD